MGSDPGLLEDMRHFVKDSLHLPAGLAAAQYQIISEAAYLPHVQQGNIRRLFVTGGINRLTGYLYCFQDCSSLASKHAG